jgi:hypothetical protein
MLSRQSTDELDDAGDARLASLIEAAAQWVLFPSHFSVMSQQLTRVPIDPLCHRNPV